MNKQILIVAPHEDDEIIGCFELIEKNRKIMVLYPDITNISWAQDSLTHNPLEIIPVVGVDCNLYLKETDRWKNFLFVFPDPVYETHPAHRKYGYLGEEMLRKGVDVLFYSINMQAPYIRETKRPDLKEEALNFYYPRKSNLWNYEHKYFLFEGQCKWIGGW